MTDDSLLYFAYGSNMALDELERGPDGGRFLGPARLSDHRLAFTRDSKTWQAGAADVVPAPGMFVWGGLYRVGRAFVDNELDAKEGAGAAYARVEVEVEHDGRACAALTYVVVEKNLPELRPSDDYVQRLVDGAEKCRLPEYYREFLRSLGDESSDAFRQGYFAVPTRTRRGAEGMGLLRVSPEVADSLGLKRLAAIRRGKRVCMAKVSRVAGIDSDRCEVDQNVRHALGVLGYETYGATVTLHPVAAPRFRFASPLIQPRMLFLRLHMPRWMDSEKSVCVLHENNIRLLGLTEGDYVQVFFAAEDDATSYRICSGSFRVFSGSAADQPRGDKHIPYPLIDELYLDADGRTRVGVPAGLLDVPVMVGPDLSRLFSSRLLFYGATVFLAAAALWPVLDETTKLLGGAKAIALAVTVVLAFGLTAVFALFDIRGRVRY